MGKKLQEAEKQEAQREWKGKRKKKDTKVKDARGMKMEGRSNAQMKNLKEEGRKRRRGRGACSGIECLVAEAKGKTELK